MIPTIPHIHKDPYSISMEEEEFDTRLSLGLGGVGWGKGNSIVRLGLNHNRPPHTYDEEKREVDRKLKERFPDQSRSKKTEEQKVVIADETTIGARKKLRLTEEQSTVLESKFREHPTLNLAMKKDLAQRLGLRPRQVEVWFQNRRARTKLKKTEMNCELMKRWCESLSEDNRRLKKELQELRLPKAQPLPPTAMLSPLCLSCGQPVSGDEGSGSTGAVD